MRFRVFQATALRAHGGAQGALESSGFGLRHTQRSHESSTDEFEGVHPMLILGRRPNESLRIGSDVIITVLGVKGDQIRLGITAPRHIVVDREEVHQRKLSENGTAAGTPIARRSSSDMEDTASGKSFKA
jgi:carbon storage regulator